MSKNTVLIAGFIGLVFGFLLTGTIGVSFFDTDEAEIVIRYIEDTSDDTIEDDGEALIKDAAKFAIAYDLTESIYLPISADTVSDKIENGETFILYAGRDTCPYCQQYVPVLMEAVENLGYTVIYHLDTIDPLNSSFVSSESIYTTPTTFVYIDGVLVEEIVGYVTLSTTLDKLDGLVE